MPTSTKRPAADVTNGGSQLFSAGTTTWSLLNDDSDASYISQIQSVFSFSAFAIPSGASVKSVTIRVRTALGTNIYAYLANAITAGNYNPNYAETPASLTPAAAASTQAFSPHTTTPWSGLAWTQADLDALQLYLYSYTAATRCYEAYADVLYASPPTVSTVAVSATNSLLPVVSWAYTQGTDGDVQTRYEIKIYSAAQYGAGGFTPDSSTASSSDIGYTSASAQQIGTSLVNGTTYKAYVRVADTINGAYQTSVGGVGTGWAVSAAFTIALDAPAPPTLTVATDAANFRASLIVQGHDNLLTEQDANAETTVGTWVALTNCSVARSTTQAISPGVASVRLSSTAAGDMEARTPTGTSGYPVVAARTYRLRASFRAGATTRSCKVGVRWYDSGGVIIGAAAYSATVSATNAAFIEASADVVAPAGALYAAVAAFVVGPTAGAELFYVDQIGLQENAGNAPTLWYRGGFYVGASATAATAVKYYIVEYSDDAGVTWATVRGCGALTDPAGANQLCTTQYDYEMQPNVTRQYRARAYYTQSSVTVQGANAAGSGTVQIDPTEWWIKDPVTPARNLVIYVTDEGPMMTPIPRGVFKPLNSTYPIVTKDSRRSLETTLVLESTTSAERTALLLIFSGASTLLLQSPSALGPVHRYIEVGDVTNTRRSQVGTLFWRDWTIPYVEVSAP